MPLRIVRDMDPQQALGVFFSLAGFEVSERETTVPEFFHRVYPSIANGQYALLTEDNSSDFIGAAAWYCCAPAYAAIVLNETRPITPAEARSADKDNGAGLSVICHTTLTPYGAQQEIEKFFEQEIKKITGLSDKLPLYRIGKYVKKSYSLISLNRR